LWLALNVLATATLSLGFGFAIGDGHD